MELLKILKNPVKAMIAFSVALIVFDLQFWVMKKLPAYENNLCLPAGEVSFQGLAYALVLSLLTGLIVVGVIELYQIKKSQSSFVVKNSKGIVGSSSLAGVGVLVATMSTFCTTCTVTLISLVSLGTFFEFFARYNFAFRILSFVLILGGLWQLNRQLRNECSFCK